MSIRLFRVSSVGLVAAIAGAALPALAQGGAAAARNNQYGYPEKLAPRPTTAAITMQDLMTRVYIFADDSMMGRQSGHEGNMKGTDYIAAELRRLGVEPAGENGTYFQTLPYIQRKFSERTSLAVNGTPLRMYDDFVAVPGTVAPRPIDNAQVVFGGNAIGDAITPEQAAGKFVILFGAPAAAGGGGRGGQGGGGIAARFPGAAGVAVVDLDALTPASRRALNNPQATYVPDGTQATVASGDIIVNQGGAIAVVRNGTLVGGRLPAGRTAAQVQSYSDSVATAAAGARGGAGGGGRGRAGGGARGGAAGGPQGAPAANIRLTRAAAERLLGRPLDGAAIGTTGGTVNATLDLVAEPTKFGRNVVGVIRGSDPKLRGQYVAIGAHNDHVGFNQRPVNHDSLRARSLAIMKMRIVGDTLFDPPADRVAALRINVDSLARIRPARLDSINNGADDDGSGSMGALEIAEALARSATKPKRSVLFIWHTAEEGGLRGSAYFASNPTVPIDSIVTQINIDMIGRGRAEDAPGGGDRHLGVLGASRLSKQLGSLVESVNRRQPRPFKFDNRYDDPTIGINADTTKPRTWVGYNNLYGRSDHANYARKCIPIAFFFTGLHNDYHQVTDEAQYIDYPHFTAVTRYMNDLVVAVANAPVRPPLDTVCTRS